MANQGGVWPKVEVNWSDSGPRDKAFVWLSHSCVCCLTGVHPGFHSVAIGWVIKATWQATREDAWWTFGRTLHENVLKQKLSIIWGTWESNPGPNACNTRPPPTEPPSAFVNNIIKNYNIWKKTIMLGYEKTR